MMFHTLNHVIQVHFNKEISYFTGEVIDLFLKDYYYLNPMQTEDMDI